MDKRQQQLARRKKRLRQKRIKSTLMLCLAVFVIFMASNGIYSLVTGKNNPSDKNSNSSGTSSQSQEIEDTGSDLLIPDSQPEDLNPTQTPTPTKPKETEYTTLVNKNNALPSDFTIETRTVKGTEKLFDARVASNLEDMLSDASKAGYPMFLVSTYRTVAYQEGLYKRKIQQYLNSGYSEELAKEEAGKWVAIPGTSEHNLGLAADIVSSTWYNSNNDLTQEFENTAHFTWLKENCYKYGFVIRYPKGKEEVTGISYEPWHYRYVGVEVATYLTENGLTLEEYHNQ